MAPSTAYITHSACQIQKHQHTQLHPGTPDNRALNTIEGGAGREGRGEGRKKGKKEKKGKEKKKRKKEKKKRKRKKECRARNRLQTSGTRGNLTSAFPRRGCAYTAPCASSTPCHRRQSDLVMVKRRACDQKAMKFGVAQVSHIGIDSGYFEARSLHFFKRF